MIMATVGFLTCTVLFTLTTSFALPLTLLQAAILAVPFAVISSAVAIPSSNFLPPQGREFVVCESAFSDILGALVFFSLLNSNGTVVSAFLGLIGGDILSLLLACLFGLYAAGKLMHLSPLILVLLFGLALNNPRLLARLPPFRKWLNGNYDATLNEFEVLTSELTFAVRGGLFILLGYWTNLSDLASLEAWLAAILILGVICGSRYYMLRMIRFEYSISLTWIAPRPDHRAAIPWWPQKAFLYQAIWKEPSCLS